MSQKRPDNSSHNPLPSELIQAENVLAQLAGVFWPSDLMANPMVSRAIGQGFQTAEENPDVASRYRILVEQIPAVVFMAFLDKGFSEAYVSPQIEAMLGFTQEEWLRDPVRWYRQIHPEDKARWSTEASQILLTGEPLRSVYRVLSRDNRVIWFHCEVRMVRRADGRPWFLHGVGFDITELKQVEEALRQTSASLELRVAELRQEIVERTRAEDALSRSEETLRAIFEYAPDTMVVVDGNGHIERVNAQVERMFGYRQEELVGQKVEVLLPERFRHQHIKHRAVYSSDPHLRPMGMELELYGRRSDGSEFPVEIMLSPVSGEAGGFIIAVIRNITRRKNDETALREYADRQKELSRRLIEVQEAERRRIALELHDEIGQLLTGLKLTLETGTRGAEEDSRQSMTKARMLVNELMARTRKLSLDLRPATLDHLGLFSALLWLIKSYSSQTQVQVDFKHEGISGKRFLPGIETAAYRVVQEALTNVARHAEVNEAIVRIWADQDTLTVTVADQGVGFDPQAVLAAGNSNGVAGMRERVLLLGGHFAIASKPGEGTRLTADWNLEKKP